MLDQFKFLKHIEKLKTDYNISIAKTNNPTINKRITILVTDAFLIAGGDIHQNFYFEQDLYQALKSIPFTCDPIQAEEDYWEMPRKERKGWNPLKLVSENASQEPPTKYMTELVNDVINILKKEVKNGVRRDNHRRRPLRTFKSKKVGTFKPKKKKRTSLHIAQ